MIKQKKYTNDEEKKIAEEYIKGSTSKELKERYGFKTTKSIIDKVKKYFGEEFVRTSKESINLNKDFSFRLNKIDSKFKAYFLGIVSSDGYINENKKYVEISMTDQDVIEFIATSLNQQYFKYNRQGNRKPIFRVRIFNEFLVDDLKRFNIVNKKSKILKGFDFDIEEQKYLPYYIRGCIDGDGWIRKDGKEFFLCSASKEYICWINFILVNYLYMKNLNISADQKKVYYIRTSLEQNINILKAIVYDEPYGMKRKFKLLQD